MDDELSHAFAAARRIFRRSVDRGTFLATFCLPAPQRNATHALGAFIRLAHDAIRPPAVSQCGAGHCGSTAGEDVLPLLHERIEAIWGDRLDTPAAPSRDDTQWALLAVASSVKRFGIPRFPAIDLVDALGSAATVTRYATWRSLGEHCLRTGGSAAMLATAILGATHSDASRFAAHVGQATRLTAILRDLARDLEHGRMLLPLEDLARVRCGEKEIVSRRPTPEFRALIDVQVERARELLLMGADGICWLAGDGSRLAAARHVTAQLALLDAVGRAPERTLTGQVRITPTRHLRRLGDAWRLAQRSAAEALPKLD